MNKQIYEYVYMADFNNPAAKILSCNICGINSKQFLRWALLLSSSHLTPNSKGWQFKVLGSGAAIGTIIQCTCERPTAITQRTQTAIATTIMAVVEFVSVQCLSRGYFFIFIIF